MQTDNTVTSLFVNVNHETYSLSLSLVEDCGGIGVWEAAIDGETRYIEAPLDTDLWKLVDSAVHCYEMDENDAKSGGGRL